MRVWVNGHVLPVGEATVSVLDHGFTVGDGVFETLKIIDGLPFAPTRHIARLRRSAAAMALLDPDPELVAAAMGDAIAANREEIGPLGRLRITYTSGSGPLGSDRGEGPPTLAAVAVPARPWPPTTTVVTVGWPRNERGPLAGVKSTSYAENAIALERAKRQGASEALLCNTRGELCEGTGSNVFLIKDGVVLTPPVDSGCLAGVTRGLVCEWFDVRQRTLLPSDLGEADEIFITSSTRDIHPVTAVDGRALAAGPVARRLAAQFAARAAADLDP